METKAELLEWARSRRRVIPPLAPGCPCGCMTKRPYLIDPACTAVWPVRDDPVCGACGTLLDPGGSCYECPRRALEEARYGG